jgi:hypothetical protein
MKKLKKDAIQSQIKPNWLEERVKLKNKNKNNQARDFPLH